MVFGNLAYINELKMMIHNNFFVECGQYNIFCFSHKDSKKSYCNGLFIINCVYNMHKYIPYLKQSPPYLIHYKPHKPYIYNNSNK